MKIIIWIFFWKLPFSPVFPYIFVKGTDVFSKSGPIARTHSPEHIHFSMDSSCFVSIVQKFSIQSY